MIFTNMTVGLVINTTVKPCREIVLEIARCIQKRGNIGFRFFYGSPSTTASHFANFALSGVDGLIICGFRKEQVQRFLREVPSHPPIVLGTYCQIPQKDRDMLGCGGTVMLDNEQVGRLAADFFHGHGLESFAFIGSRIYREFVASEIRCSAFETHLRTICGEPIKFDELMIGHVESNEDCWDESRDGVEQWLKTLPLPCGIFVSGELEAFWLLGICKMLGIDVPGQIEILCVDNAYGFCELTEPTISSMRLDYEAGAQEALQMLISLIDNPNLPDSLRDVWVGTVNLQERGSTASGRGYGLIVERAKDFIRTNACAGIEIMDVARHLGVSRRTLELRFKESAGQGVLSHIHAVRLKEVCRLLTTTDLSITEVTARAGYPPTGNLVVLFKKTFGMSMREYRRKHRH